MENVWERFDNIAKPEEVMEAKSQFEPVQEGVYKVLLESIEPSLTKSTGLPMLKGKFRIVDSNRILFYNQNLQVIGYDQLTAKNIAEAVDFINGLLEEEVEFTGLSALAELVPQIPTGSEHFIEVSYDSKDFDKKFTKLKIVDKPEELELGQDTDDIPF